MWEAITIILLLLAFFLLMRRKAEEPTDTPKRPDTPRPRLPDPTVNPFSPPAGIFKPILGNDPSIPGVPVQLVHATDWAGGRRVIRRPDDSDNPGGGRTAITMPLIRWAQARYDAYQRGVGDQPTYTQALGILEHVQVGGWFLVASPPGQPESWERYDPPQGQILPARVPLYDALFERGPSTAATILRSEI